MKKRAIAGVLIVFAGVFVAAYPWLSATYFEYNKNKMLNQWEGMVASGEMVKNTAEPESNLPSDNQLEDEVWDEDTNAFFDAAYVLENMEGVITIDKINLRYPILRGDTKSNLDLTICAVTGSPEMGSEGNYCLAGHKSRIYGRQFNRLMELEKGDNINLSNAERDFDYVVVETIQVSPKDTWVLDDTSEAKALTLITCDYTVKPIGRFVVKCEIIEYRAAPQRPAQQRDVGHRFNTMSNPPFPKVDH